MHQCLYVKKLMSFSFLLSQLCIYIQTQHCIYIHRSKFVGFCTSVEVGQSLNKTTPCIKLNKSMSWSVMTKLFLHLMSFTQI